MNKATRMMLLYGSKEKGHVPMAEHDRHDKKDHESHEVAAKHEKYGMLDEHTAREWVDGMENEDGTTGPHWTMEQTKSVAAQRGITCDPVEFWAAMNMVYSDYCGVAKKLNVNNLDFYICMATAFLDDKDAGEGKMMRYYRHIVA